MTTVYYAHPMSWYNSEAETADIRLLERRFDKIINPGSGSVKAALGIAQAGHPEFDTMSFFMKLVQSADAVAFRPFSDGKLGAGVGREVFEGILHDKRYCSP